MLKLKKVQILGFKSFCDRTEVQLSGEGIAAIVGPNGCGKSNISDAITWVLGEQSAKSLRGIKMEDVIFAGTRDRKPTGMAEVSLTLVDPEVYDGASLDGDPEIVIDEATPTDWDETSLRQQNAAETEEAVAEAQPGTIIEGEAKGPQIVPAATQGDAAAVKARANTSSGGRCAVHGPFRTSSWAAASVANHTHARAGSASASPLGPSPPPAAPSSKKPPASPASKPKNASPNSASKPPV